MGEESLALVKLSWRGLASEPGIPAGRGSQVSEKTAPGIKEAY